ncbi:MAG: c-type cytochrome [Chthoniobacterales bacterium]
MMKILSCTLLALGIGLLTGCDWSPPGKPQAYERAQSPAKIQNASILYAQNCIACHSNGENKNILAGSLPLNDPTYFAFIPEAKLREVIASGIPGTSMPAFAQSAGGMLTDHQIDILVASISSRKPATPEPMPPYDAAPGDVVRGAAAFGIYCASCHGGDGKGGPKAGSVVDPAYLGLVSNQYLRTIVVIGRPDLGMPNWKNYIAGKTMSNQEVSDVVAWLASHRPAPGSITSPLSQPPTSGVKTP